MIGMRTQLSEVKFILTEISTGNDSGFPRHTTGARFSEELKSQQVPLRTRGNPPSPSPDSNGSCWVLMNSFENLALLSCVSLPLPLVRDKAAAGQQTKQGLRNIGSFHQQALSEDPLVTSPWKRLMGRAPGSS